ncbi:hypothetical protein V6N12_030966 [Hibiscus sabdariffa]|uniref:Uncharacterized protein n=1 Tax=Hibiscus sabdariffa TaxID=183260 RepID=A0ABR2E7I8_9ROSI
MVPRPRETPFSGSSFALHTNFTSQSGFGGRNVHSAWTTLAAFCRFGLQGVRRKYTWPRVYSVAMADWQKRLI